MSKVRDHISDIPVRTRIAANRAHVRASNAWHRAAGNRIHGTRQQYRNWLTRRAVTRGKSPLPDRVTRAVGSRTPGYRDRINPATGRKRREDMQTGRLQDQSLARLRERTPRAAALNRDLINGAHRRVAPSRTRTRGRSTR